MNICSEDYAIELYFDSRLAALERCCREHPSTAALVVGDILEWIRAEHSCGATIERNAKNYGTSIDAKKIVDFNREKLDEVRLRTLASRARLGFVDI